MRYEFDVVGIGLIDILEFIGQARTTGRFDAQADTVSLTAIGQMAADMPCGCGRNRDGHDRVSDRVFLAIIGHRSLDRVFSQNRTMNFDWRQGQLLGNLTVFEGAGLGQGFPLDPLGHQRTGSDG